MTNMQTVDQSHEELMKNTTVTLTKNTKTLTEDQTGTRHEIASYKGNLDDYYMVDYHVEVDSFIKWVRSPFKTLEEVAQIANSIHNRKGISNFRILPEKWLSQLRDNTWNDETNSYTEDDITNRVWFFGSLYEELAEHITGDKSLMMN
jgi:hypoxanthine phosphoribosyltransferase